MKLLILTKRSLVSIGFCMIIGVLAAAVAVTSTVRAVQTAAQPKEIPIYRVQSDKKEVAISFDAAWGNEETEQLLDILDEHDVKATFFLVGDWVDKYPDDVKNIAAHGHDIGNHSDTHPHLPQLSTENATSEIQRCNEKIEALTGSAPTLFRPPYGDYNNDVVLTARAMGYEVIQWSVDSLDWKNLGVQPMIDRATKSVRSGDIVLFHNDSQYILEALPAILKSYQAQGYTVVPVSQLLLPGETTIDVQGRQHAAAATIPEV